MNQLVVLLKFGAVIFVIQVIMMISGTSGLDIDEPVCTSRFDYDYKMLQKMHLLEIDQNKLREQFVELKDENRIDQTKLREQLIEQTNDNRILNAALKDEITQRKALEIKYGDLADVVSLDGTGASYIRWGRQSCPGNGTHVVYKGFAGGAPQIRRGAAANYLCLPEEPLWNVYDDEEQTGQTVWGARYEFLYRNMDKFFGKPLGQRGVPCSACHTKRAAILMIPGRNKCYDGWTLEYHGYLMAGADYHFATEFVCLDAEPEALLVGTEDQNGKLFFFVEAHCGSLRCPPYVNGRELTCAVCSK